MKTVLAIQAHPGTEAILERHWPYWVASGATLFGIGREDGAIKWPEPIRGIQFGKTGYVQGNDLPARLVVSFMAARERIPDATDICVIEYDCITLGKLAPHTGHLVTHHACGGSPGFLGSAAFHCPWWADRETTDAIVRHGVEMVDAGQIEKGFPDRFLGLLLDKYRIPWTRANSYSQNAIDRPQFVAEARRARANGVQFIHGIKTAEQLDAVMKD